jgi:hypothetical protein
VHNVAGANPAVIGALLSALGTRLDHTAIAEDVDDEGRAAVLPAGLRIGLAPPLWGWPVWG